MLQGGQRHPPLLLGYAAGGNEILAEWNGLAVVLNPFRSVGVQEEDHQALTIPLLLSSLPFHNQIRLATSKPASHPLPFFAREPMRRRPLLVSLCVLLAIVAIASAGEAKEVRNILSWLSLVCHLSRQERIFWPAHHVLGFLCSGLRPFSWRFSAVHCVIYLIIAPLLGPSMLSTY